MSLGPWERDIEVSLSLLRHYAPQAKGHRLLFGGETEGYRLAFSGGKDSVCLLQLARESGVAFESFYNVTTCDPPELVRFIRREHPQVRFSRRPDGKTIWTLIQEQGFPTRQNRWCCHELKERVPDDGWILTGIRDAESPARKERGVVEACFRNGRAWYLHPIKHWSTELVWWFIRDRGLKYCSLYDEGFARLGCVICPNRRGVEESMRRWPGIWRRTRRAFLELYTHRPSLQRRFADGEALWQWWISRDEPYPVPSGADPDAGQGSLFGEKP